MQIPLSYCKLTKKTKKMLKYPKHLQLLINSFKKFPGVGNRTAERFAFQVFNWPLEDVLHFSATLSELNQKVSFCPECSCLTEENDCHFCQLPSRNTSQLCLIASVKDAYALEEMGMYQGLYHVLGSLLSPIEGKNADGLPMEKIKQRVKDRSVKEVIIALDSTLEGEATALYIKEQLENDVHISRLAFGLPIGSCLDFVDGGTLARSFTGRRSF
ncbi:Recombination protein RecR [Candidatus Rhabdochlamydia oedothoracis]|uniref:Recombination protein RecR n=2 Tax=Candidatus Rhabdochlamydia TaxID=292833 RepID=A0ABX8V247_9BACT|nr:recombination mediator RecR [Candidatus Rhabdochlamydia oedothoracis]KAG6559048.1 Recombination protein RecR [Candidatus Rhabdochlamydia sp. W815]MCL6756695.1 recombination mediator RecR [Candidatus Rhabdochlamydia oedothoracis]QYF48577.1 Recombination protein RecR [Candidatus Rhabdochlamydia oedothoracis]